MDIVETAILNYLVRELVFIDFYATTALATARYPRQFFLLKNCIDQRKD